MSEDRMKRRWRKKTMQMAAFSAKDNGKRSRADRLKIRISYASIHIAQIYLRKIVHFAY